MAVFQQVRPSRPAKQTRKINTGNGIHAIRQQRKERLGELSAVCVSGGNPELGTLSNRSKQMLDPAKERCYCEEGRGRGSGRGRGGFCFAMQSRS